MKEAHVHAPSIHLEVLQERVGARRFHMSPAPNVQPVYQFEGSQVRLCEDVDV